MRGVSDVVGNEIVLSLRDLGRLLRRSVVPSFSLRGLVLGSMIELTSVVLILSLLIFLIIIICKRTISTNRVSRNAKN